MVENNNQKWYDNSTTVDTLLFILPPVGIYGLFKTRSLKSNINKILYGILGFISFLLVIVSLTQTH